MNANDATAPMESAAAACLNATSRADRKTPPSWIGASMPPASASPLCGR